jgi:hypothetical protein
MKTCESKILTVKYKKNNLKTCESSGRKQLIVIYDLFNSHKQIRNIRFVLRYKVLNFQIKLYELIKQYSHLEESNSKVTFSAIEK